MYPIISLLLFVIMLNLFKDVNAWLFRQSCISNGNKILCICKFCMSFSLNSIAVGVDCSASCNRFAEVSISKNVIARVWVGKINGPSSLSFLLIKKTTEVKEKRAII